VVYLAALFRLERSAPPERHRAAEVKALPDGGGADSAIAGEREKIRERGRSGAAGGPEHQLHCEPSGPKPRNAGVQLQNTSRQFTRTNDVFFVEQVQNINVLATEEQLVDFLYKLGTGASMIRVRDLELQPDLPHQRLVANIKLVASYQKNPPAASAAKTSTAKAK
jgi:hypothetical protein